MKVIKKLLGPVLILLLIIVLVGCSDSPDPYLKSQSTEGSRSYTKFITEIEGCRIYYVYVESSANVYLTKCGNSTSTQWQAGKTVVTSITVEDQEILDKADKIRKQQAILNKLTKEEKDFLLNLKHENEEKKK